LDIYNKEKYLERIGHLQEQTLKEIEIIAINDASTDNSLNVLKKMSEKGSRIKIINNKKNSGSLYSRAMGILSSKGEYLLSLDPDDRYQAKTNLKYLYNISKKLKVDIVSFLVIYLPSKMTSKFFTNSNEIIRQPELYQSLFKSNILNDYYITNKLVKREIFLMLSIYLKKYIYGEKWCYYEDNIWIILIYKYANSSIFINKKIYISLYIINISIIRNIAYANYINLFLLFNKFLILKISFYI
jgi:glycosyltransferase involved in cell wall biosynthesis